MAAEKLLDSQFDLWRNYVESSFLMETLLDRRLKDRFRILHVDYGVLRRLGEAEGNQLRMVDLAAQVWFSRSRLSHQIDKLERAGLVERVEGRPASREMFAKLTPVGYRTLEAAQSEVRAILREHFFAMFSDRQIDTLSAALGDVAAKLRTMPECNVDR